MMRCIDRFESESTELQMQTVKSPARWGQSLPPVPRPVPQWEGTVAVGVGDGGQIASTTDWESMVARKECLLEVRMRRRRPSAGAGQDMPGEEAVDVVRGLPLHRKGWSKCVVDLMLAANDRFEGSLLAIVGYSLMYTVMMNAETSLRPRVVGKRHRQSPSWLTVLHFVPLVAWE